MERINASQIFPFTCSQRTEHGSKKDSRPFRKNLIQMPCRSMHGSAGLLLPQKPLADGLSSHSTTSRTFCKNPSGCLRATAYFSSLIWFPLTREMWRWQLHPVCRTACSNSFLPSGINNFQARIGFNLTCLSLKVKNETVFVMYHIIWINLNYLWRRNYTVMP